ncbi:MAG: hypothetical protein ACRC67_42030 [Inquilinus sp.]|uniref:hypothetical protein n=1 Tax=Inquilinus sp. TaxID=1932117 RepID=UPI003F406C33
MKLGLLLSALLLGSVHAAFAAADWVGVDQTPAGLAVSGAELVGAVTLTYPDWQEKTKVLIEIRTYWRLQDRTYLCIEDRSGGLPGWRPGSGVPNGPWCRVAQEK